MYWGRQAGGISVKDKPIKVVGSYVKGSGGVSPTKGNFTVSQDFLDKLDDYRGNFGENGWAGNDVPGYYTKGTLPKNAILPNTTVKDLVPSGQIFELNELPKFGIGTSQRIINGAGGKVAMRIEYDVLANEAGVSSFGRTVACRGGGGAIGIGSALMEGGGYFVLGVQAFDHIMGAGPWVVDSLDGNKKKPWAQYKEEHIYRHIPPWARTAWVMGSARISNDKFMMDMLTYGPQFGPSKYAADWVIQKAASYFDRLNNNSGNR